MENKGIISVSDAFNASDEELNTELPVEEAKKADEAVISVSDETKDGEIEKTEIESETVVADEKKDVKVEAEAKATEKTWTELGLPQYEGLSKAEIAERVSITNREYGRATNTIGQLRKQIGTVVDTQKPANSKETKEDVLAAIQNLDEAETVKFNAMYEVNPAKAILTYGGDAIKEIVRAEIENRVPANLDVLLQKKADAEKFANFMSSHSDITDGELEWMKQVDTEYLAGQERPYEELYELSQMWKNKAENVEDVYNMMKKYPTMSIAEAKKFTTKAVPAATTVSKEKVAETVKKLTNANHTSQTSKTAEDIPDNIGSVQEAFDSVTD
ncbi:MAG: hypothetical protein WC356_01930 [Candidatus Micrarchaeia archaeon]|jgi:hypothetical protein